MGFPWRLLSNGADAKRGPNPSWGFLAQDREAFCALESDEAMFTYTKDRTPFLEEPLLDPRPSYNLVVEDAEGFSGWAGIDRIEGTDQRPAGLVSPFGPLGTRLCHGGQPSLARLRLLHPLQSHDVGNG